MARYIAEVFHTYIDHGELLAAIPIEAKSRKQAYEIADDLFHYPWKPFLTRRVKPEDVEIKITPETTWKRRASTILSKSKERAKKRR